MTNHEFREWLRGFFDLADEDVTLTGQQLQVILNHLNLAEAVEGKLDAANAGLWRSITHFRSLSQPSNDGYRDITTALKQELLSAA